MAKKAAKTSGSRASGARQSAGRGQRRRTGAGFKPGQAKGKHLVIVESPSKAKTINKYLGPDYLVLASVGHVRDLPSKNPKGDKSPIPGVDLEREFAPTYEVLPGKDKVVSELKRAAKESESSGRHVWFATDLDREGEAIAWHLAEELGIDPAQARRVIFSAITRSEIGRAFANPHRIDLDKVNAQQARRILDRIVGYQVSPLLWKKVARGLSAGRVQSVAARLIVEREREIRVFVPDEFWQVVACFTPSPDEAHRLGGLWEQFTQEAGEKGAPPTIKDQNAWLSERGCLRAELIEVNGKKFDPRIHVDSIIGPVTELTAERIKARIESAARAFEDPAAHDLTPEVARIAEAAGLVDVRTTLSEEDSGVGPARWRRTITGRVGPSTPYRAASIETKRSSVSPPAPYITSTLQQSASSRLGFGAHRTMRAAQQLYEGVEIPGEGPVGLITYMRTDSTHVSDEAIESVREYIGRQFGSDYLPDKPRRFASSNKSAQEAHEAIRPASLAYPPARVKSALTGDQYRLYRLIWERFVACQMTPALWDATTVLIEGGTGAGRGEGHASARRTTLTFKATGRVLVFDGFYRVAGVPTGDTQTLPSLDEAAPVGPFSIAPRQRFTSPPARYTEASLIKTLEAEGIGRPSTYADIIAKIQARKYVEQIERRFWATDLGEVVTDKLIEAFPRIMDIGYTREMEAELDRVEDDHLDWIQMLEGFYGPFKERLEQALENLKHAKAEIQPAPKEYRCQKCDSDLVYRFGKNGRFLSCSRYPDCDYACPIDRQGRPRGVELVNIACPKCSGPMTRRTGRFGPFVGCARYGDKANPCDGILNIDKKGHVTAPSIPPLQTDLPCPTCDAPLYLRTGVRGPWLGCSTFPKCRGRGKWSELDETARADLERRLSEHERANPVPIIRTLDGRPLTDARGKPLPDAPTAEALVIDDENEVQRAAG